MPYSIDTTKPFIQVRYTGTIDNNDIQNVLQESLKAYDQNLHLFNRIEDMRNLRGIRLGFNELLDFTQNLRAIQLPQPVKTAILTANPLQYGMARMFQSILEHSQMKIQIFTDEEAAKEWVTSQE
jgi:hypothetical protein